MSLFVELEGTAGMILKPGKSKSLFFKPFESAGDVACRGSSIIVAPALLTGESIALIALAGWELLKAIGNLLTFNFSELAENSAWGFSSLEAAPMVLITALASPLINLVDFIGSIITSINQQTNPPEIDYCSP
ncbi:hypothetical protein ACFORL_06985 [Legionella dresdenensis]|uniref:Uncharacterized protein n=1 Tax=Legionella dresdenensis TaxID=450200 RepID=A0ABV8CF11_9GAMM